MKPPQRNPRRKLLKHQFARELRAQMTKCEAKLWLELRRKQFAGLRFRRQQPVGPYVADFYCAAAKLIVELDGDQHYSPEQRGYDERRTRFLAARGYRVLRFSNVEFLRHRGWVLDVILGAIETVPRPPPSP